MTMSDLWAGTQLYLVILHCCAVEITACVVFKEIADHVFACYASCSVTYRIGPAQRTYDQSHDKKRHRLSYGFHNKPETSMESPSKAQTKPQQWTEADVQDWLRSAVHEFDLAPVDASKFKMDGAQLTDMTMERFLELEPYTGDILYEVLRVPTPA